MNVTQFHGSYGLPTGDKYHRLMQATWYFGLRGHPSIEPLLRYIHDISSRLCQWLHPGVFGIPKLLWNTAVRGDEKVALRRELQEAMGMLERNINRKNIDGFYGLMENGMPTSTLYSSANLEELCQHLEGWQKIRETVLSKGETTATANMRIQNWKLDEIEISLSLFGDFRATCTSAAHYISTFGVPLDSLYPLKNAGSGELQLYSLFDVPYPSILWIYHNIHVKMDLFAQDYNGHPDPSREDVHAFIDIARKVFQHFRDRTSEIARPMPEATDIQFPTNPIQRGQMFDVRISRITYLQEIRYDHGILAWIGQTISDRGHSVCTFVAQEAGNTTITISIEDTETFNLKVTHKISQEITILG